MKKLEIKNFQRTSEIIGNRMKRLTGTEFNFHEDLQSNDSSKPTKRMTRKGRFLLGGDSHQHIEFVINSIGDQENDNENIRSKTPTPKSKKKRKRQKYLHQKNIMILINLKEN